MRCGQACLAPVKSDCRVVGGSGQTHRITPDGCALVEEGWG
ncbi:hypothetical protein [Kitasatospora aureofaciens]|nr:hypothetical protein [Kitasatospora aureofaciens]